MSLGVAAGVDVQEGPADRPAFGGFGGGEGRTTSPKGEEADFQRDTSR